MNVPENYHITAEQAEHYQIVEQLAAQAFGPGRFTRTAFRLREGIAHEPSLSFVGWLGDKIIASVRLTKILVGSDEVLLLGPLVVATQYKNQGYGGELMQTSVKRAKADGHPAIILVGDLSYYQKFGFERVPKGNITLPGPVDPARLLICKLNLKGDTSIEGLARPFTKMDRLA